MRRYVFYLAVAILTFSLSLTALTFYALWEVDRLADAEMKEFRLENPMDRQENWNLEEKRSGASPKYVCEDKTIKPVWSKIVADKDFQVYAEGYSLKGVLINCADEFAASYLNLDADADKELVVKAKWKNFCGMYSGCWLGIFKKKADGYETIFVHGNTFNLKLGKIRRNFRDVIIDSNAGNGNGYRDVYQYDGNTYKLKKCFWTEYGFYKNSQGETVASDKVRKISIDCVED